MLSPPRKAGKRPHPAALFYAVALASFPALADRWPLDLSPKAITGTFMEPRSAHYHSGLDIRTAGRIGIPVVAPVAGSVTRIRVSPTGYGKAIYLQSEDGRVFVFAHLSAFASELQAQVTAAWLRSSRYEQDLNLPPGELRVSAGELLALSGATGTGAPHLHVEIRDTAGRPRNPLRFGLEFPDDVAPRIEALRLVALSEDAWIEGDRIEASLAPSDTISLCGSFALELRADDRAPNAPFPLMPYRIEAALDGVTHYSMAQEQFDFEQSGQMQLEVRRDQDGRWLRLQRRLGNELPGREAKVGDGSLRIEPDGGLRELSLTVRDAAGNQAAASVWLRGRRGESSFAAGFRWGEAWLELAEPARVATGASAWRLWTSADSSLVFATARRLPYELLPPNPFRLQLGEASGGWTTWGSFAGVRGGESLIEPRPLADGLTLQALDPTGKALFPGGLLWVASLAQLPAPLPAELRWTEQAWQIGGAGVAFDAGLALASASAPDDCGLFLNGRSGWELLERSERAAHWELDALGPLAVCCDRTPPRLGPWRDAAGRPVSDGVRLRRAAVEHPGIGHPLYAALQVDLTDLGAGLQGEGIEALLDGKPWPARWDPEDQFVAFDFFLEPGPGQHRLELNAQDRLGNRSRSGLRIVVEP